MRMPLTNGSTCNLLIKNIMGLKTMPGITLHNFVRYTMFAQTFKLCNLCFVS